MSYCAALRVHAVHGLPGICRIAISLIVLLAAAGARAADDPRDLLVIMPALNDALENERSGKDTAWSNVVTGRAGAIRIERTFYRGQQPCREYTRTTSGNGPASEVRGTGCRTGKLNWSVEEARTEEPATAASPSTAAGAAPAPAAPVPEPAATRTSEPSGDPSAQRAARKPPPTLRYGLPTRSQL
jgi:surface antigen